MRRAPLFAALGIALSAGCSDSPVAPSGPSARTCSIAAPTPASSRLHADGTLFRDALDRVVFLRGVDAGGRSKFAPYVPFDYAAGQYATELDAYMARAEAWGIDVMRVPFTWAALEPTEGTYDDDWMTRYDQLLDAAWAHRIWTVVDFHQDVYAELFCGDGFPDWTLPAPQPAPQHDCPQWGLEYLNDTPMEKAFDHFWADGSTVQTAYIAAWDKMVARHKDRPGVLGFELINEPGWGTADLDTFEATTLTAFFSRMAPHVRALAPSSLVFIDLPGFDGVSVSTSLQKPKGDGLVFAPHYYPLVPPHPEGVLAGLQHWSDVAAAWNVPVFVGEFGTRHDLGTAFDFMSSHFDALDAIGSSGTEWEYSVAAAAWNEEADGLVKADGTEYPVARAVVRPFARAVAGGAIAQGFDTASSAFALTYAPAKSGVTEVSLPARAYPSGFDLDLQGACVDASTPGQLRLQADAGVAQVSLHVTPK